MKVRPDRKPILVNLRDIEPKPVQWLWFSRFPMNMLSLLVGDPGLGKTWAALDMAARVSTGANWPDNTIPDNKAPLGSVLLLSAEDTLEYTIRPRLDKLGADPSRIYALKGTVCEEEGQRFLNIKEDIPALEKALTQVQDAKIIILDPITAYLGETDSHKNAEVRAVLAQLSGLAERHKVAIIGISHMNKDTTSRAIYRVMGSMGFVAAARATWTIVRDKHDEDRRLFVPLKINLCPEPMSLAFRITDDVIVWENEPVKITAEQALAEVSEEERTALDEAIAWLRDLLNDGRVRSTEVVEMASREKISESTLRRAKAKLSVRSEKEGIGNAAVWYWKLPEG